MTDTLSGRGDVIEAVRVLLTRPLRGGRPYDSPQPILVVEGARGSGKTALLEHVVRRLDGVPYAYLNLDSPVRLELPQILSAIACQLNCGVGRYEAMTFPRLAIGVIACGVDVAGLSEAAARQRIAAALGEHRRSDAFPQVLCRSAGDLVRSANPPGHRANNRTRISRLTRPRSLGGHMDWYARGDIGPGRGLARLSALAGWSGNVGVRGNRQRVGHLLWRAFLADLTEMFRDGRRADEWTMNCLVLIDNVDGSAGRAVVSTLAHVRREQMSRPAEAGDPLTVVVSSVGRLLADEPTTPAAMAELADWDGDKPTIWLRATMRDLSLDEVSGMVSAVSPRDSDGGPTARSVYRLTRGNPMATDMLLRAIQRDRSEDVDLASVLRANAGNRTLADEIIARLLGELSEEAVEDLVTLASARNRAGAVRLAAGSEMVRSGDLLERGIVPENFWSSDPLNGPGALRCLLLRRLAARPEGDHSWNRHIIPGQQYPSWTQAFEWLRDDCQQISDYKGELHYRLAAGGFADVVNALVDRLDYLPGRQWLDHLHAATSAPRRDPGPGSATHAAQARGLLLDLAQHDQLMRAIAHRPVTVIADLVARLWVMADPLSGEPLGALHWQLAGSYQDLRGHLPDVPEILFELQRRHRRLADQ